MSAPIIQPYLFFGGRCGEAMEFYRTALGATVVDLMRFREAPDPPPESMLPPGFEDKIMHGSFKVGDSLIMASDGCGGDEPFSGFSLSLAVTSEADADRFFQALAAEGEITMPLGQTFWSPKFGMVKDRFGVGWMINLIPDGSPVA